MGCPPVRGDNPRALVSGLLRVQMDSHEKAGKGCTNISIVLSFKMLVCYHGYLLDCIYSYLLLTLTVPDM